jgi:hypothetical protein
MKHVETIPGMWGGGGKRRMEWVNLTMIHYKNFWKYQNEPPGQQ